MSTYCGRSARRQSAEHGIVYTGKEAPVASPAEIGMQPYAIRVIPDDGRDKLDYMTRVNYGKVYTVEHNVKVRRFGVVDQKSLANLLDQFRNVWVSRVGMRAAPQVKQGDHKSFENDLGLNRRQKEAIRLHGSVVAGQRSRSHSGDSSLDSTPAKDKTADKRRDLGDLTQLQKDRIVKYYQAKVRQLADRGMARAEAADYARTELLEILARSDAHDCQMPEQGLSVQ